MRSAVIWIVALLTTTMGCSRSETEEPTTPVRKETPVGQQVIDGVTGRAAVRTYLDTKETLKGIEAERKERQQNMP